MSWYYFCDAEELNLGSCASISPPSYVSDPLLIIFESTSQAWRFTDTIYGYWINVYVDFVFKVRSQCIALVTCLETILLSQSPK